MIRKLIRLRRPFRRFLEAITLLLMTALALVVVAGIVFRKAGASLVWYDEVASILLVWLTYYGAALAALDRAHIGFPRFVESARSTARLALVGIREAVIIGFFLLVAWAGWRVLQVLDNTYVVSLPWLSAAITQSVIPIGAVLFIVAELISLGPAEEDSGDGARE